MKTPLTPQLCAVSMPVFRVGYSITAPSPSTLLFRVHEGTRVVSKDWWVTK